MQEKIIGIGRMHVGSDGETLTSIGLGSCVGLILYDKVHKIGGMAHIMLPDSNESKFEFPNTSVLVAEHDEVMRRQLKDILTRNGFSIAGEAVNHIEAVEKYDKLTMGSVLMSIYIPELKGIDTMKMIREKDIMSKVILMSPRTDQQTYIKTIEEGADELIYYPFMERKVIGVLKSVIFTKHIRFADVAVPALYYKMVNRGARPSYIEAKLIGGANIFENITSGSISEIGTKNIEVIKKQLALLEVRIIAEDIGKNFGRTVKFDIASGEIKIKTKTGEYSL